MAFKMSDSIQLGEHSMSSGMGGASYNSDGDPNVLNANWDHPDNRWNDNGAFAFLVPETLFISRPASAGRANNLTIFFEMRSNFSKNEHLCVSKPVSKPA